MKIILKESNKLLTFGKNNISGAVEERGMQPGWRSAEGTNFPLLWPGLVSRTRPRIFLEFVVGSRLVFFVFLIYSNLIKFCTTSNTKLVDRKRMELLWKRFPMTDNYKMSSADKVLQDDVKFYFQRNDSGSDVYNDDDDKFEAKSQITQ